MVIIVYIQKGVFMKLAEINQIMEDFTNAEYKLESLATLLGTLEEYYTLKEEPQDHIHIIMIIKSQIDALSKEVDSCMERFDNYIFELEKQ